MSNITAVIGTKENLTEDVSIFSKTLFENPEIIIVTKKDIKSVIAAKASSLFFERNSVIALLDPEKELLDEIKEQLTALHEKIHIIIYLTSRQDDILKTIGGKAVVLEQDKEKRIKDRVLSTLKKHDKVMTDKGFKLLSERVKDESVLETELMKLINFIGGKKEIKSGDVASIVTEAHEENLLAFFDIIARADKKERLNILENLLFNGLNTLAIQGFLVKQTRLMLQAKDMEEIFKASSDYPAFSKTFNKWKAGIEAAPFDKKLYLPYQKTYYAYRLSKTSQKFTKRDLLFFLDMLLAFDVKVKRGTKYDRIFLEHGLLEA